MTTVVTNRAHGVDLSKYDLTFDPSKSQKQLDFAIQRASYGLVKDEGFDTIYAGVQNTPIRIAYHYLNSGVNIQNQIDKFLSVTSGKNFHAYAVDFEAAYNTLSYGFAKECWDFIREVAITTGKRAFLYTNVDHYNNYIYPSSVRYGINWNQVDLWISQWLNTPNPNGQPTTPNGRTSPWSIWQYQNSKTDGFLYGIGRTTVDLDVFNGTVEEMRDFLGIPTPPTPEPLPSPTVSFSLTDQNGETWEAVNVPLVKRA